MGISWWNPSATSEKPTSSRKLNARILTVGRSLTNALIASAEITMMITAMTMAATITPS